MLGLLLERTIFRRLSGQDAMSSVLATVALAMILENGALILWGPQPQPIPTGFSPMPVKLGSIFTTEPRLFAVAVTFGALLLVHLFLNRSLLGSAMRATFQQPEAAALVGIPSIACMPRPSGWAPASPRSAARCSARSSSSTRHPADRRH